jgi:hypothetical protein
VTEKTIQSWGLAPGMSCAFLRVDSMPWLGIALPSSLKQPTEDTDAYGCTLRKSHRNPIRSSVSGICRILGPASRISIVGA